MPSSYRSFTGKGEVVIEKGEVRFRHLQKKWIPPPTKNFEEADFDLKIENLNWLNLPETENSILSCEVSNKIEDDDVY